MPLLHDGVSRPARLRIVTLVLTALTTLGAGCTSALEGSWRADEDAENQTAFYRHVQFKEDGTFSAISRLGDEQTLTTGKYDFDGFKLTLKAPGKAQRVYSASYIMGGKLELRDGDRRQTLYKQ